MWILVMAGIFTAIVFGLGLVSTGRAQRQTDANRRPPQSVENPTPGPFDMAARGTPQTSGDSAEKMAATGK